MLKNKKAVKTALAFVCTLAVAGGTFGAWGNVGKFAKAEEAVKTVYDVSKDYPGATGNYVAVSGSGGPEWYYQALNTDQFHIYGAIDQDVATGALTTNTGNTTLKMYPMIRNGNQGNGVETQMADGSGYKYLDYLVQYPAGNGIGNTDAEIGQGYITASAQYCNIYGGQYVHPGTNLAVVYSFVAPRDGVVYLEDTVSVMSEYSDGVRFAIFHQPVSGAQVGYGLWGGVWGGSVAQSLYGAIPVYPTAKVAPQANGTGWKNVYYGSPVSYRTGLYSVAKGDVIHFVLDDGVAMGNDLTWFTPAVVYTDGVASMYGTNLSLKGNIGLNFYMQFPAATLADAGAKVVAKVGNAESEFLVKDAETVIVDGNECRVFSADVAVKDMDTNVQVQTVLSNGTKGETYTYSVGDYAQQVLENAAYASAQPLVKEMVNFGAQTKGYFAGETVAATQEMNAVTAQTLEGYRVKTNGTLPAGVTVVGSNLELKGETTLKIYFTAEDISAVECKVDGVSVAEVVGVQAKGGETVYVLTVEDIAAKDLDTDHVFSIGGYEITYNALSYAYTVLSTSSDAGLVNVVKALYLYNQAANAYFGA